MNAVTAENVKAAFTRVVDDVRSDIGELANRVATLEAGMRALTTRIETLENK